MAHGRSIHHLLGLLLEELLEITLELDPPSSSSLTRSQVVETKDDSWVPDELEKWEVSPNSTYTQYGVHIIILWKTPNPKMYNMWFPSIIWFPM